MAGLKIAPELFERLLASEDPLNALHRLDAFWCARAGRSEGQRCFGLSRPEFDVHVYLWYLGEVGNGGHCQFFQNPSGDHSAATLEALERLELRELASVLAEACAVFPGGVVPEDRGEREAFIGRLPEEALSRWASLDRRLYSLDMASGARALAYVRAHRDEVLVAERS